MDNTLVRLALPGEVRQVIEAVYAEERCLQRAEATHFQPEVPLFIKQLAPGRGLAEEPDRMRSGFWKALG